jgi:hypothetical protein
MHMPSSVSASCALQVPWWNQLKVIAHLAKQTTIQMQHATRFSAGCTALRRGLYKMHAWRKHIRPRWSAKKRRFLIASVPRESTTGISDLINLMSATLTLLRCLVRGSLHREIQPCQK